MIFHQSISQQKKQNPSHIYQKLFVQPYFDASSKNPEKSAECKNNKNEKQTCKFISQYL